jgi:hypothetical protein
MAFGLMAVISPAFGRTHAGEVPVTVRVYDYVDLPALTRDQLTSGAKRVLGQAGILLEFSHCYHHGAEAGGPGCAGRLGPGDFVLRIFEPRMASKGEQLGYAAMTPEEGAYITVFIDPRKRKARAGDLSDGGFLGHAVAHEIGHLLLGANSHSSSGIMRPVWRPCDEEWMAKGVLLFSGAQGRRMRSALTERAGR